MIQIAAFTFNPFQENTFILYDETKECVIIDPGCYSQAEKEKLSDFIEKNELTPVRLLNTHCHIDHILGNKYVSEKYGLLPEFNEKELEILLATSVYGPSMGIQVETSPNPENYLDEGDVVTFGNSKLDIIFTPGHCPGEICFYSDEQKFVIGGDVLFQGSIGRTDLPGGDYATLINSIKTKLLPLGDDYTVFPGHGPETTIGKEKMYNQFLM